MAAGETESTRRRTLAEVADRVGVSARTVSRVVNDEGGFSSDTRERVLAAIREVGYRPNLAARALVTNSTNIVGLMVTSITDPYFPELAESIGTRLAESRRTMILASTHHSETEQRRVLDTMISQGVDGIIAVPAGGDLASLMAAADLGIPVVVIDVPVDHPRIGLVSSDVSSGGALAARHLIEKGHRRIGMVSMAAARSDAGSRREQAFLSELETHGVSKVPITRSDLGIEAGTSAGLELLGGHPDITAVFGYNDGIAAGVMRAASSLGHVVPDDLAVVGFDDIDLASIVVPALTTIRLDREELGRQASNILTDMINHPSQLPVSSIVPVELVERAST